MYRIRCPDGRAPSPGPRAALRGPVVHSELICPLFTWKCLQSGIDSRLEDRACGWYPTGDVANRGGAAKNQTADAAALCLPGGWGGLVG